MKLQAPRIHPLPREQWTDEVKQTLEGDEPGRKVKKIFSTLANHPDLLTNFAVFGTHIRFTSTLGARERQLMILRTGWHHRCEYEWAQHRDAGLLAGLSVGEIERIKTGPEAPEWQEQDVHLLTATDELLNHAFISDDTWQALSSFLSVQQVMDLVFTVGQYVTVCMALNSFGVELEDGQSGF